MSETSTHTPRDSRLHRLGVASLFVVLVGVGVAGCGSDSDSSQKSDDSTTTTVAAGSNSSEQNATSGQGSNGDQSTGEQSGGGNTTPAPTINSFTTPDDIDCHNGNLQNFTASWSTTNATKVTISIDGAGIYNTYGASGSTSLPFNCSSSHTFLLTAYSSDNQTSTKSVTLEPRNAQTQTTTTT